MNCPNCGLPLKDNSGVFFCQKCNHRLRKEFLSFQGDDFYTLLSGLFGKIYVLVNFKNRTIIFQSDMRKRYSKLELYVYGPLSVDVIEVKAKGLKLYFYFSDPDYPGFIAISSSKEEAFHIFRVISVLKGNNKEYEEDK